MKLQLLEDMHYIEAIDARDRVTSGETTQIDTNIIKTQLIEDINEFSENVTQIVN